MFDIQSSQIQLAVGQMDSVHEGDIRIPLRADIVSGDVSFHAKVVSGEKFRGLDRAGQQHKKPPFVWEYYSGYRAILQAMVTK
jgi:hypothetical protein